MIRKKRFLYLYFLMLALELLIAGIILSKFGFDFYQGGDSPGYMLLAKNLVKHGTLSFGGGDPFQPTNFRTPGYPLFLALIYLIFHLFVPAIFFGALISAFAAPMVYLISHEIFSPLDKTIENGYLTGQAEKMAFVAGLLTAIAPMGLFLGVSILTEGVFTPLLLLAVYFFVRYLKAGSNVYLYGSSVLLALATLIRPIMFYFWPLAILFILYKEFNFSAKTFKKAVIFVVIFFIVLSPWLIRNKIVVNSWQITGLQGYIFFVFQLSFLDF